MLTEEQYKENMIRMQEIVNNNTLLEKINWKLNKMSSRTKKNSCVLCKGGAVGVGMFLLHKSQNSRFNLKEDEERVYLYYICERHALELEGEGKELEVLKEIESKLADSYDSCVYVEIK